MDRCARSRPCRRRRSPRWNRPCRSAASRRAGGPAGRGRGWSEVKSSRKAAAGHTAAQTPADDKTKAFIRNHKSRRSHCPSLWLESSHFQSRKYYNFKSKCCYFHSFVYIVNITFNSRSTTAWRKSHSKFVSRICCCHDWHLLPVCQRSLHLCVTVIQAAQVSVVTLIRTEKRVWFFFLQLTDVI